MWLTLENEQTDNSGTAPSTEATPGSDSLPPGQPFRRVRDPSSGSARRSACRGAGRVPHVRRGRCGRRVDGTPRIALLGPVLNYEETHGLVEALTERHPDVGLIVVREQRSDLEDWVDELSLHAVLSPAGTRRPRPGAARPALRLARRERPGASRATSTAATRIADDDDRDLTGRFCDGAPTRRLPTRARMPRSIRNRARRAGVGASRRSRRASPARRSPWSRRRVARARRRSRSTSRPASPRSRRTRSCSSMPTCSSATSRRRSTSKPERTIVDAVGGRRRATRSC